MQPVFAITMAQLAPIFVFLAIVVGSWALMSFLSNRTSVASARLARINRTRGDSLASMGDIGEKQQKFASIKEAIASLGTAMEGKSDLEKNKLKMSLAHAGFRSDNAPLIFHGLRVVCALGLLLPLGSILLATQGLTRTAGIYSLLAAGVGFYLPTVGLWVLRTGRQKEIFLTLPDALDLLVVCVESGLGLDAAMRKVTDEMSEHAKTISSEFAMANLQLQMGKPRREVLHDLGVRTGVDDMKALAAILIQADRFGSSIANALRVQSDSMRTRRRQIAEEKAAKTAVQLIFPLVLFIFPAIFVVLCGPAAIQIQKGLFSKMGGG